MPFTARFRSQDVEIETQKTVYQGFFSIIKYQLKHKLFAGGESETIEREVFVRGDAVGVLLYDSKQQKVVLAEQFRTGALADPDSPWLIEVVAGGVKAGESLEAVAKREVLEEMGLEIDTLRPIASYYVSPGGDAERMHLFCAEVDASQASGVHGLAHEHEDIQTRVFSLEECFAALEAGTINNASTLISLQWLKLQVTARP